jgi:hypothetical protein
MSPKSAKPFPARVNNFVNKTFAFSPYKPMLAQALKLFRGADGRKATS